MFSLRKKCKLLFQCRSISFFPFLIIYIILWIFTLFFKYVGLTMSYILIYAISIIVYISWSHKEKRAYFLVSPYDIRSEIMWRSSFSHSEFHRKINFLQKLGRNIAKFPYEFKTERRSEKGVDMSELLDLSVR